MLLANAATCRLFASVVILAGMRRRMSGSVGEHPTISGSVAHISASGSPVCYEAEDASYMQKCMVGSVAPFVKSPFVGMFWGVQSAANFSLLEPVSGTCAAAGFAAIGMMGDSFYQHAKVDIYYDNRAVDDWDRFVQTTWARSIGAADGAVARSYAEAIACVGLWRTAGTSQRTEGDAAWSAADFQCWVPRESRVVC